MQFIPLTPSGRVTLSAQANFITVVSTEPGGSTSSTGGVGPFTHGWPSVTIQLASKVPANRTISLSAANGRLTISAPSGARAHLYYLYIVSCPEGGGSGYGITNAYWQPISGTELAAPSCPGTDEHWRYSVAASGYAIASGMLQTIHGRGFSSQCRVWAPGATIAAAKAITGVVIEISFIATFTRRFFGR